MCDLKLHHMLILVSIPSEYLIQPGFGLSRIFQLHETHLNSSEGKEYVRRKMKSKPTLKWPEPLFRLLMRVVYKFKNFKIFVIFCFHIVARTASK